MTRRWIQHTSQAKCSKNQWHFLNAIRKYGPQAFTHEILAQSWSVEDAGATEEILIEQYKTRDPENGFNIIQGGISVSFPWNDERRARQSILMKEICSKPTVRENRIAAVKKMWNNPDFKEKMRSISREVHSRPEFRKKLSLSSKGRVFDSMARANNSAAQTGKKVDTFTKQKISQTMRKTLREKTGIAEEYEMTCKYHGDLSEKDCYIGSWPNGFRRARCKKCSSEANRKNKPAR